MKIENKSVTEVINSEYREYAMYVLENRAIPSAIDGMKMVHRKLVYAMLTEYGSKKVKLNDLGSISRFGYHHGESSAMAAAVTITADWNNNCPVFTGHGNFGSRLVQEAAAPRYIFASLSPEFKKIFIDTEIAPVSLNEENPEPIHYLPVIPWVLVNGISGIAVGFACDILPRSVTDLVAATKACIKNSSRYLAANDVIAPTFPHFRGTVTQESDTGLNWATTGMVEYIGKYSYKISELPIGYDREAYINLLNKLIDTDMIKDYDDDCSESGFGFTVKVSGAQKLEADKDPIKYFKLKKLHSENLTTLGHDGKLKIFKSVAELVHYFCEYRLSKFVDKIDYDKKQIDLEIELLTDKQKFISHVINGDINFKTTTKDELLQFIADKVTVAEYGKTFSRIPLYDITLDAWNILSDKIKDLYAQLVILNSTTAEKLFQTKINTIKL
jgi:DNA gyrase/topoisomerase IV subunit A